MPAFKKIKDYTQEELNEAVTRAEMHCIDFKMDFWKILNGVDAYFERRRRKEEAETSYRV